MNELVKAICVWGSWSQPARTWPFLPLGREEMSEGTHAPGRAVALFSGVVTPQILRRQILSMTARLGCLCEGEGT